MTPIGNNKAETIFQKSDTPRYKTDKQVSKPKEGQQPFTKPVEHSWRPHEESNLDLRFRKPVFYPLNYGGGAKEQNRERVIP